MTKLLVLLLFSQLATSTIKVPLSRQVNEGHGVVWGVVQGVTSTRLPDGEVYREVSLALKKMVGLSQSKLLNKNNFILMVPGGFWQGIEYKVPDSPSFQVGEEVLIVLEKFRGGHRPYGLANGKFLVEKDREGVTYLTNRFLLGEKRILLKKLFSLLDSKYTLGFDGPSTDKYVYRGEQLSSKGRMPAQAEGTESPEEASSKTNTIWLALIFGLLGAISMHKSRGK